ncbi:MAG: rRNA maturation RNase YbeY [Candidatus Dojkabacteria bacterium]|jgi:probable rRNA maturation factor
MNLEIFNWSEYTKHSCNKAFTKKALLEILKKEFSVYNISSVNIIFVNEGYIRRLNKEFRKIDSVTDVLSFNLDSTSISGEVYICPKFILKNMETDKYDEEILRSIVHGILHIVGYDHKEKFAEENKNVEEMFVKQEDILQNILNEINNGIRKS